MYNIISLGNIISISLLSLHAIVKIRFCYSVNYSLTFLLSHKMQECFNIFSQVLWKIWKGYSAQYFQQTLQKRISNWNIMISCRIREVCMSLNGTIRQHLFEKHPFCKPARAAALSYYETYDNFSCFIMLPDQPKSIK